MHISQNGESMKNRIQIRKIACKSYSRQVELFFYEEKYILHTNLIIMT